MAEPSTLTIEHCFCHNSDCPDHGKRGHGDVYFRGWSGRDKRIRMVYCRTCRKASSERKGTAFERSLLPTDKVVSVGTLVVPKTTKAQQGTNRALGQQMAADMYGWTGDQWACLDTLWAHESGWRTTAGNKCWPAWVSTSACGRRSKS